MSRKGILPARPVVTFTSPPEGINSETELRSSDGVTVASSMADQNQARYRRLPTPAGLRQFLHDHFNTCIHSRSVERRRWCDVVILIWSHASLEFSAVGPLVCEISRIVNHTRVRLVLFPGLLRVPIPKSKHSSPQPRQKPAESAVNGSDTNSVLPGIQLGIDLPNKAVERVLWVSVPRNTFGAGWAWGGLREAGQGGSSRRRAAGLWSGPAGQGPVGDRALGPDQALAVGPAYGRWSGWPAAASQAGFQRCGSSFRSSSSPAPGSMAGNRVSTSR